MAELFECSGTQFDPGLVHRFVEFQQGDQTSIRYEVAHRWLRSLEPGLVDSYWNTNASLAPKKEQTTGVLFQDRLLESMYDAVVFVDAGGRVVLWNRGTERLTGIAEICAGEGSLCGNHAFEVTTDGVIDAMIAADALGKERKAKA